MPSREKDVKNKKQKDLPKLEGGQRNGSG